jgi:glycosyltransferase involved in cell wall biosynthesis
MKKIVNVAILGTHLSWDGGVDFLSYLINGITTYNPQINIILLLPYNKIALAKNFVLKMSEIKSNPSLLFNKNFLRIENRNTPIINSFKINEFKFKIEYYNYTERDLVRKLKAVNADIVFPTIKSFGSKFPIPWIGYIPDLQHKYFSDNFSTKEKKARDHKYQTLINEAKGIIVNSESVKRDLIDFYDVKFNNIFSLPFTPPAPIPGIIQSEDEIRSKYQLTGPYFIISNQFWKHKDHLTAFKAFEIFQKRSPLYKQTKLVCTGRLYDNRFSGYVEKLLLEVNNLDSDGIVFTEFISKSDQLSLLNYCLSVIQPTQFEGGPGGGIGYNAISHGKPIILSDIPINKEVLGEHIFFFETGNPASLAIMMEKLFELHIQNENSIQMLVQSGEERTISLGKHFDTIFNTITSQWSNTET